MQEREPEDENRIDFNLLKRQLSSSALSSPGSSGTSSSCNSPSASSISSSNEIWPLRLNTVFLDHYIFGDAIGNGSYAEVRECIDTRNLERCAVKIVNKEYLIRQAPNALVNQLQEIRLLKRFKHQNIISLKECLFKGPKIYIVLEHCTFVLSDLIDEQQPDNKLCISMAKNLFHQLVLGINYLHSIGIVHRDIKPQNLLITTCGTLKIIDFGVSHVLSMWISNDLCSNHEGSPLFQAPEVVSGQNEYSGFKVDVWSAGVTLYLMLFGQYPFMSESLLGLYDKILSEELRIPEIDLHNKSIIADLLAMMLDKVSTRRPSIDQIQAHPWLLLQDSLHVSGHSDFIDLATTRRQNPGEAELQNMSKDSYRSMSVLPYLHSHHFPNLQVRKLSKSSPSSSPFQSREVSPILISGSPSSVGSSHSTDTSTSSPHEIIEDTPLVWGTEEQYNLIKVPVIRANRIGYSARRRRKRRRASRIS